jgi:hypothetical protein
MRNRRFVGLVLVFCPALLAVTFSTAGRPAAAAGPDVETVDAEDASGQVRTLNVNGAFDLNNPFF